MSKTIRTLFIAAIAVVYMSAFAGNEEPWTKTSLGYTPSSSFIKAPGISSLEKTADMFKSRGRAAEQWFSVGLRFAPASTWLLNGNVMSDKSIKYVPGFGFSGGAMIGFNFNEVVGLNIEGLYDKFNQRYASRMDTVSWDKKTGLTFIDIPVLLHFTFGWKYLEVGVNFQKVKSVSGEFTSDMSADDLTPYSAYITPTKEQFNKSNTAIIFGWGSSIWGVGGGIINTGLRFSYGVGDITGANNRNPYPDPAYPGNSITATPNYKATHSLSAAFVLSFDFDLGYFMSSSCGRKHSFVLFQH